MDKVIDRQTLVENMDQIVAGAATGETRFIVAGQGTADVVIARVEGVRQARTEDGREAMQALWTEVRALNLPPMTTDEIDEEIAAYRREKREAAARGC